MSKYEGITKAYYVEQLRLVCGWYLEAHGKERTETAEVLDREVTRLLCILTNWDKLTGELT